MTNKIKIYGHPLSTCTLKVLTVANALSLSYEVIPINALLGECKTPEHLENLHPFGKIPVLVDTDGFRVYESRAICRYLATKYQTPEGPQLYPQGDVKLMSLEEQAISVEQSYYAAAVGPFVFETTLKPVRGLKTDLVAVEKHKQALVEVLEVYECLLKGKDYLVGEEMTVVDIFHLPHGHYIMQAGFGDVFMNEKRPNVARWWKNISNYPHWTASLPKHN